MMPSRREPVQGTDEVCEAITAALVTAGHPREVVASYTFEVEPFEEPFAGWWWSGVVRDADGLPLARIFMPDWQPDAVEIRPP